MCDALLIAFSIPPSEVDKWPVDHAMRRFEFSMQKLGA